MFLTVAKIFIALLRSDGFCAWTDFALGRLLCSDGFAIRPPRISGFVIRNALQMRIFNAGGFFRPFGIKRQSRAANPPARKIRRTVIITNDNGKGKPFFSIFHFFIFDCTFKRRKTSQFRNSLMKRVGALQALSDAGQ